MDRSGESEQTAAKKRFRREALTKRDGLTAEQRRNYSGRIIKKLIDLPCYVNADAILTYVSFRSEVDSFPLIERAFADGKAVFAPKVLGKEMDFFRMYSLADLTEGYRGILEPSCGCSYDERNTDQVSQSTLICLPGAAFDRARHRIGYGGGFYDRYLSRFLQDGVNMDAVVQPRADTDTAGHLQRKVTTAALAYDCQIFEEIPWETHDIRPAHIITETEII